MLGTFSINGRTIGSEHPTYIIAEMSANHGQSIHRAKEIIRAMKEAGADAVKIQTYTPDTITLNCDNHYFTDCLQGTLWEGQSLYKLYGDAYTPWEWHVVLQEVASEVGLDFFSTPFDETAVDLLETLNVPVYKIASFEIVHLPLIRRVAKTGKPMIISTGMASQEEIHDAMSAAKGAAGIALLKCTSAYPARMEDAHLKTMTDMHERFRVPVGISDHTMGSSVPLTAVGMGGCIIEKHFVLDREKDKGPDSAFSMEPREFAEMVLAVRAAENRGRNVILDPQIVGNVRYGGAQGDSKNKVFRPSIFVVERMRKGEVFTQHNTRIIRPGYGLPPKEFGSILGRKAIRDIERGTPLLPDLVAG
jgi:pseudaminic acid synthase